MHPRSRHCDPPLTVSVDTTGGLVVLVGELDRDSAHQLLDALAVLARTDHRRWSVDAADVAFCDAGGLRALACAHRFAAASDRDLQLVAASRCVRRLVTLVGLGDLLADAVAGPEGPEPVRPAGSQRIAALRGLPRPAAPAGGTAAREVVAS